MKTYDREDSRRIDAVLDSLGLVITGDDQQPAPAPVRTRSRHSAVAVNSAFPFEEASFDLGKPSCVALGVVAGAVLAVGGLVLIGGFGDSSSN